MNLRVKKGDTVKVGDVLGTAAVQNNGLYRFEMQVNKESQGVTTYHCPVALLDPAVKESVVTDLTKVLTKWEQVKNQELYTQEDQNPVGCVNTVLTQSQVGG